MVSIKKQAKQYKFLILACFLLISGYYLLHVPYKTTYMSMEDLKKLSTNEPDRRWTFKEKMKEAQAIAEDFKPIEGEDPIEAEKRFMKHVEEKTKKYR